MPPRALQEASRWAQERLRKPQDSPNSIPGGSKVAPRALQEASRAVWRPSQGLRAVSRALRSGLKASEVASSGQKPEKIIPPRLKKLHEALDVADTEIQEWKDLHDERKTMLKNAKSEMKQIVSGEKMITDEDRKLLPESEEAYLRGLSDGQGELEQVKLQEKALALAQRAQLSEMALKRKILCEMATDTDLMMKKLKAYSEHDTLKSD